MGKFDSFLKGIDIEVSDPRITTPQDQDADLRHVGNWEDLARSFGL